MEKKKHQLNGDPTAFFKNLESKESSREEINPPKKTSKLIKGLKKIMNPVASLIYNIANKISSAIDMVSKVHYAAPYLLIIAALYYRVLPMNASLFGWLSLLSGASAIILCYILWHNSSELKHLDKQKWGVFWVLTSQSVVQLLCLSSSSSLGFTYFVGGLLTLITLPFFIYFKFKCEDDAIEKKEN